MFRVPCSVQTREALIEQVERLRRLAERQLKRARLAGAGGAGLRFDPNDELPTLARLLGRIHAPKVLDIQLDIRTSGPLDADREDMLELLGNLLDNACKWADTRVRCSLLTEGKALVFKVEDDGLGLAIAKEIVESYRGRIAFGHSSALGGLYAEVRLPPSE